MASKRHHLTAVDGFWYYVRRVPTAVLKLLPPGSPKFVKVSTGIAVVDDKDRVRATKTAIKFNEAHETDWKLRIEARECEAATLLVAAIARAKVHGYRYAPIDEVAKSDIGHLLNRIETMVREGHTEKVNRVAFIGGGSKASIMLSKMAGDYNAHHRADHKNGSDAQRQKGEKKIEAAMKRFIAVVGDKDMLAVTHEDAEAFREWWNQRRMNEDIGPELAIKDMQDVNRMIREKIGRMHLRDYDRKPFDGVVRFKRENNQRKAWELSVVRDVILKADHTTLDPVCYEIMLVAIGTGARPSEIVALQPSRIKLEPDQLGSNSFIPHIQIRADGRKLKTKNALRDIPLVGVALAAMQRNPQGFPQYNDRAADACTKINAWLRQFQPEPEQGDVYKTIYCMRHTFADRLHALRVNDAEYVSLMGHEAKGAKYGAVSLETKAEIMAQIAY
jgi:integrase